MSADVICLFCLTGSLGTGLGLESDLSIIMRDLSKSSHMLFIMYRRHGIALCPAQLYNDFQCTVKDYYVTLAKIKHGFEKGVLASADFHPYQLGTDRQELQFGGVRTLTHDRSVDMQRLPDRLSAATQMEDIFERNPEWKRASRRLSTGANDHINVRSTTGSRSTVDVDVRNCWEGGRADAVAALNAHPAYSVSVQTFIDAAAEPGVTMVRPRGVLVGVKLLSEELNDDREVGNGNGGDRDGEVPAAGDDASASLLEDVLAGAASPSDIDGPANTILLGGHVVCKASAYYIVFGKGTPKSNDRLKRVRGIGRARTMLPIIDEDDESDMH